MRNLCYEPVADERPEHEFCEIDSFLQRCPINRENALQRVCALPCLPASAGLAEQHALPDCIFVDVVVPRCAGVFQKGEGRVLPSAQLLRNAYAFCIAIRAVHFLNAINLALSVPSFFETVYKNIECSSSA